MKRNGKIAHLPENIQEQLNNRLHNGETGQQIIDWLNALPEFQAVMARHFGGRPLSHQNISEWRHGGYKEWLDKLDARPGQLAEVELQFHNGVRSMLRDEVEEPLVRLLSKVILGIARHAMDQIETSLPQANSSNN